MRVNTKIVFDWDGAVLEREWFTYHGPVELCDRKTSGQIAQQGISNSSQDQTNATAALGATNKALTDYSSNLNKFMDYGRSTYGQNGEFAKDQNTIANTVASAGTKSVGGDLALNALRTGQNTAGYATADATARSNAEQGLTSQLAGADATRLQNLTNINQFGVQASALPATVQAGLYGTSVGGANQALAGAGGASAQDPSFGDTLPGDLTAALGAAGNVGAGYAEGIAKGCWIAARVFDEDFETGLKTHLVREWLWTNWIKNWYAPPILWLYSMFGKRAAKSAKIVRLLSPLFHRALREAINGR